MSLIVVFPSPSLDHASGVIERSKPMFIQALVSKSSVEAFDISVLVRFTRIDLPQVHIALMRPVEHCLANELRSIVTADV